MTTTLIRNASFVIAWDAGQKRHAYMPDADLAFRDGAISFVGRGYDGPADQVVDGKGLMVMPGMVN
ncbi:MAG: N-ethylammeline chlorohydrolase, partial [Acetobacteraceae bacterium]|nr:N-ethylammeline chlorohydrolase [Acetobacteraceae bacterium]